MGYDTYLNVDDVVICSWRKHTSILPRLLFKSTDVVTSVLETGEWSVEYRATAEKVRSNLEEVGLGWSTALRNYAAIRIDRAGTSGMLIGSLLADGLNYDEVETRVEQFASLSADVDLAGLSSLLAAAVAAGEDELERIEILDLDNVVGHISPMRATSALYEFAQRNGTADPFPGLRAAESLVAFHRDAPIMAWLTIVAALVEGLDASQVIVLDLSEDANENPLDYSDIEAYADGYWSQATDALVSFSKVVERMYSGLGEVERRAGREYWVARSSRLIGSYDTGAFESAAEKGRFLEDLVETLVRAEGEKLAILDRNMRLEGAELDLVLRNELPGTFWASLKSPLFLVECKNWDKAVGVETLRTLESKVDDYGDACRVGILVSVRGFTRPVVQRLKTRTGEGRLIFLVELDDVRSMVDSGRTLSEWLGSDGMKRILKGQLRQS